MKAIKLVCSLIKSLFLSVFKTKPKIAYNKCDQSQGGRYLFSSDVIFEESSSTEGGKYLFCAEGTFKLNDDFSFEDFLDLHCSDESALEKYNY